MSEAPVPVRSDFANAHGGAELYWRAVGPQVATNGEPLTIVCCNGVGVSTFFFHYMVEYFSPLHRVLVWDYRGHGRSSLPPEPIARADLSIERNAEDLREVLVHAGIVGPIAVVGHSMGCQVAFEYARRYPEQVAALVALFGAPGRPLDTLLDIPNARQAFDVLHRVQDWSGKLGATLLRPLYESSLVFDLGVATGLLDRDYASRADMTRYFEHLSHMEPRVFFRMVSQMADHDARPYLPDISVPALVLAGEKDLFTPVHLSREMAEQLPNAELMVLADASHAAIVEQPETINRRLNRFLEERVIPRLAVEAQ